MLTIGRPVRLTSGTARRAPSRYQLLNLQSFPIPSFTPRAYKPLDTTCRLQPNATRCKHSESVPVTRHCPRPPFALSLFPGSPLLSSLSSRKAVTFFSKDRPPGVWSGAPSFAFFLSAKGGRGRRSGGLQPARALVLLHAVRPNGAMRPRELSADSRGICIFVLLFPPEPRFRRKFSRHVAPRKLACKSLQTIRVGAAFSTQKNTPLRPENTERKSGGIGGEIRRGRRACQWRDSTSKREPCQRGSISEDPCCGPTKREVREAAPRRQRALDFLLPATCATRR
jgi:hypothetical protein